MFLVRNDSSQSEMLFQTSDLTWQTYNTYGGASLYGGNGPSTDGRAYKVSYNRPLNTRATLAGDSTPLSFLFTAEYPMIRWLEANGRQLQTAASHRLDWGACGHSLHGGRCRKCAYACVEGAVVRAHLLG